MVSFIWGESDDAERRTPVAVDVLTDGGGEANNLAALSEGVGLCSRPSVAGQTVGPARDVPFDGYQPAARRQDTADLAERGVNVGPVVDGGQRPNDACPPVGDRQGLGRPVGVAQSPGPVGQTPDPQHHRGGVDGHHLGAERRSATCGDAGPAADIDEAITSSQAGEADGKHGIGVAPAGELDGGNQAAQPGESWMVAMVIGDDGVFGHAPTLTVEPGFKSSGSS
jgi:hypothetical protein